MAKNKHKFTAKDLLQSLGEITNHHHFCVGYSGGLDSHVLLHALNQLQHYYPEFQCRAIHINHGLHPNADVWEAHCQQICLDLGIDFIAYKVQLDIKPGESVEAVAREARYQKFSELLTADEYLLTAHTRNDQAETLLLQLMRGCGVRGLAAMPVKKPFAQGYLARPLLKVTRDALHDYAKEHELVWIEDDSNLELRFDRNFVRHHVIPSLQQRWPNVLTTLTRSSEHCAETVALLDELAIQDLKQAEGNTSNVLLLEPFKQFSLVRQRNLLRYWITANGYRTPNTKQLKQVFIDVIEASEDAEPQVSWDQVDIRRFRNQLILTSRLSSHDGSQRLFWDFSNPLTLPSDLGKLMIKAVQGEGISADLDFNKINIRFRCGGERFHPAGRKGSQSLKKLLQEWGVPPWQRDRIPLVYYNDELIAVVGYGISESYKARQDEKGIDINWVE